MKPCNLICAYQGAEAIDFLNGEKKFKKLKSHEIRNLKSFCNIMKVFDFSYGDFDGYYMGYTINKLEKSSICYGLEMIQLLTLS